MHEKILIIDGHSILNRAYYGIKALTSPDGTPTNAVYGFVKSMIKILDEEKPRYMAVVFDSHGATFRHELYDKYKANRKMPDPEFRQQVPLIKQVLDTMGICRIELPGFEGDDLMGTISLMAEEKGLDVTIFSGDRDQLQLASEHTLVRIPTNKGGTENYRASDVFEKYQVTPEQFIDMKAIMGDSSDNIPGLPGIGQKTAPKIINQYGSIQNAYEHLDELKPPKIKKAFEEHYDMAVLAKRLVTIDRHAPLEFSIEDAGYGDIFNPDVRELFSKLGFKNFAPDFGSRKSSKNDKNIKVCESIDELKDEYAFATDSADVGIHTIKNANITAAALCIQDKICFIWLDEDNLSVFYSFIKDISYNCKRFSAFDVKALLKDFPELRISMDVSIAAYLINPLQSEYSYEDIALEYMDETLPSPKEILGKLKQQKAFESRDESIIKITGYFAYCSARSVGIIEDTLAELGMDDLYNNLEAPLLYTLNNMENCGIRLDSDSLVKYGDKLQKTIDSLTLRIHTLAGDKFNIQSPKQLGEVLFEKLKMPGAKKTKTGYSTAADVLEKLADKYQIVSDILSYRQFVKLKSTYADALPAYVAADGRIHSHFNQTVTATGRISSNEPNLQNIPVRMDLGREIRKVFIPEDGYVFIDADYSQIELRLLAHMSKDDKLIEAFKSGEDIHRLTASQVFHVPFSDVTDEQRRSAKAVNFGIIYGMSAFGLAEDLKITRGEAEKYIALYFETYPTIKSFLDGLVSSATERGYTQTLFHRRRPLPEIKSSSFNVRSFAERVAKNAPIQGTAADIIKIAMINVDKRLKDTGARLILQVHDELLVESPKEMADTVKTILYEEMTGAAQLDVPLEVDINTGANWLEAH